MSKIAVLGGCGFIGRHVVEELDRIGHEIQVIDRSNPSEPIQNVKYTKADINSLDLSDELSGVDIAVITSGRTGVGGSVENPQKYYQDNFRPVHDLLKSGTQVNHVVKISSNLVHGEGLYQCLHCGIKQPGLRKVYLLEQGIFDHYCESCNSLMLPIGSSRETPCNPLEPYSRSHLVGDQLLQKSGINETVVRLPFVYGPGQGGAADFFFTKVLSGERPTIFEDGEQLRNFFYVEDMGPTIADIIQKNTTGVIHPGVRNNETLLSFVEEIIDKSGADIEPKITGEFRDYDLRHSITDNTHFRETLDVDTTSMSEGVRKTLDYYRTI